MNIKTIDRRDNLNGCIIDFDSKIVFNPNSERIKLIASDANIQTYWNMDKYVEFRSKRRGYTGYYNFHFSKLQESTESEINAITEFLSTLKTCACCGVKFEGDGDGDFCKKCTDNGAEHCSLCGTVMNGRRHKHHIDGVKGKVCIVCVADIKYLKCNKCGVYFDITKDGVFNRVSMTCTTCNNENFRHEVGGYHNSQELVFKKAKNVESNLFFGFELEMDKGGLYDGNSFKIGRIVGDDVYFSRDGSIPNGFEMISQPMHYDYFMERKELYAKLFSKAIDLGYQSHTTTTCGLHFHMSRNHFTDCEIAKLIYLFEKHWDNVQKFTRRNSGKLNKWASRYGDFHADDIIHVGADKDENRAKDKLRSLRNNGRYKAINLRNENTIEIRVFKGTLNINTFVASLQFLNHLVYMIKTKSFDDLRAMSWSKLMKSDYKELNEYLLIRGLLGDGKQRGKKVVDK